MSGSPCNHLPALQGWWFVLRLGAAYLVRDWRSAELRVMALALVIAVGAVSAVNFFIQRVALALELQASSLLGGDLLLRRSSPLPETLLAHANRSGLQTVNLVQFPSVILNRRDDSQLVAVKAVSRGYPLRGALQIRDTFDTAIRKAHGIPKAGEVWLEKRLFLLLGIKPGEAIILGEREFIASKIIESESDRSGFWFQLAPRVLLNNSDLDSTGLITRASRASYRLQLAGETKTVIGFRNFIQALVDNPDSDSAYDGIRIEDVRNGRPELRRALERADRFLGLTAIVCVLLAGAAIAVAAQGFASRQGDTSAILRTFGASTRTVFRLMLVRLTVLGLLASSVGVLLGYITQWLLVTYFANGIGRALPGAGWQPVLIGGLTGFTCLLGFVLPAIVNVGHVPVLRVLRRDLSVPSPSILLTVLMAFVALCFLLVWQADNLFLAGSVIAGLMALLLVIAGVAWLLLSGLRCLGVWATPGWRFGISALLRRQKSVLVQLSAFCIGIMALLLIAVVGNDILDAWRKQIPADAPNHFAFNIQPQEVATARQLLLDAGVAITGFYPMVRARMTGINGRVIIPERYPANGRARQLLNRDYNVSYATHKRADYTIEAGQWWSGSQYNQALISVESGIAETFDLALGDRLAFRIAGERIEARIVNIRSVNWDSFKPNFYVIATPGLLSDMPKTFITSFRVNEGHAALTSTLVRKIPGITVINLEALLTHIRSLIDTVSQAVMYVLGFALLAGFIVLIATVQASKAERLRESALLKALGARYTTLLAGLFAEFVTLGAIAGLVAAIVAAGIAWIISNRLFGLSYQPPLSLLLTGTLAGAFGIGLCGVLVTRRVLKRSPVSLLHEYH